MIREGVDLKDESGNDYGKSVVAGRIGLSQVAASRVILPIPGIVAGGDGR
jgi:hypothetical protein